MVYGQQGFHWVLHLRLAELIIKSEMCPKACLFLKICSINIMLLTNICEFRVVKAGSKFLSEFFAVCVIFHAFLMIQKKFILFPWTCNDMITSAALQQMITALQRAAKFFCLANSSGFVSFCLSILSSYYMCNVLLCGCEHSFLSTPHCY